MSSRCASKSSVKAIPEEGGEFPVALIMREDVTNSSAKLADRMGLGTGKEFESPGWTSSFFTSFTNENISFEWKLLTSRTAHYNR